MPKPDVLSSATTGELLMVAQSGCQSAPAAMQRLLTSHEPMIKAIVRYTYPQFPQDDDMRQIGAIAFADAAMRFRPEHGATFSTFARKIVAGRLVDEIRRRGRGLRTVPIECIPEESAPVGPDVFESRLDLLLLRAAIARMPQRDRDLLARLQARDGSQTAVAHDLGVSQQAIQKRQHRIFASLYAAVYA